MPLSRSGPGDLAQLDPVECTPMVPMARSSLGGAEMDGMVGGAAMDAGDCDEVGLGGDDDDDDCGGGCDDGKFLTCRLPIFLVRWALVVPAAICTYVSLGVYVCLCLKWSWQWLCRAPRLALAFPGVVTMNEQ